MDFTVEVSNEIYPKQVILEAKSAFANYADFVVVPIRVGVVSLTIKPFEKYEASSREMVLLPSTSYRLGFKGLRIKEFYLPTWLVSI